MINYLEYLKVPTIVGAIIIGVLVVSQVIGELIELKGKVVPEIFKIRKFFARKKKEKAQYRTTLQQPGN